MLIKEENKWKKVVAYYIKVDGSWVAQTLETLSGVVVSNICQYGGAEDGPYTLSIMGPAMMRGETCNYFLTRNGVSVPQSRVNWNIVSGTTYATINGNGDLTILSGADNSDVTIQAIYGEDIKTKPVKVTYLTDVSATTTTETETYETSAGTVEITTTTTEIVDASGNTTTASTTVEVITNDSGETTYTETNEVINDDGSSTSNSSTVVYDESGNTMGSAESEMTVNSDGSFSGSTTNFDENGNATDGENTTGDTAGNVDTQQVAYDESGNTSVTGYEIDTTGSGGDGKDITGNGVNTEFVPFADDNCGFVMHIKFKSRKQDQPRPPIVDDPEDTGSNWLYNIMCAKTPTPVDGKYPGFDIRWAIDKATGTKATFQFRYAKTGAGNTTYNLSGKTADGSGPGDIYDIIVTYDPELYLPTSRTKLSVTSPNGCMQSVGADVTFPTNNIDFTIGYATSMSGTPYRYSNATIYDFSITKICSASIEVPEIPEIVCDGERVYITCETHGANIYYRFGRSGNYLLYTGPVAISTTTIVQAYSELMGQTSDTTEHTCEYEGIMPPVVSCDGKYITMTCETPSVDILYKLNDNVNYSTYDSPIAISADTVVTAYAEMGSKSSTTVTVTCIFDDGVKTPSILCDGENVSIYCETSGANIYYKLNQDVSYGLYESAFTISADTIVTAFAELNGESSSTITETCEYNPVHDYSKDYLTFRVLTGGTIAWKALGTGFTKTIEYSKNGGEWTSITAASTPPTISVNTGDVVRFRGNETTYAGSKSNYDGFEGGTAYFDIEGNIMSLLYGDNFASNSALTNSTYQFCSIFKKTNAVSAENLILPATTLKNYCYRAMFSYAESLIKAPALPATTLAQGCYWYMFEKCAITTAPELSATALAQECYGYMFTGCANLNYIKCLATTNLSVKSGTTGWVTNVSATGTFVKAAGVSWSTGNNGIPTSWVVFEDGQTMVETPEISCDGEFVTITCETSAATIYKRLNREGSFAIYAVPFTISADTMVESYAEMNGLSSITVVQNCEYLSNVPIEYSNRDLKKWTYGGQEIEPPYSINAIDGHSSRYDTGTFNFETSFALREAQPTYLWFQHTDQSANIYVDDVLVGTHWGGYNAFYFDISNYVHAGSNNVKVALCNTTRNILAPCKGDFNYNATLGNVKLLTSPVLPTMNYGYDGFHVTSDVATSSATVNIETTVPNGATLLCKIEDNNYFYSASTVSNGSATTFTTTIANPVLWNGKSNPHLYDITLEIYSGEVLYHRFQRGYGLRFFDYAISGTTMSGETGYTYNGQPYTGFLLNGQPYFLRGVCMHDDLDGKANALSDSDYTQEFNIIQELGCNFIRLAHYPHPKEVYDWCDRLGIIVQTEVPWVGAASSGAPSDYYTHLEGQYADMVNQHYNHPSIVFWGLSNETTTENHDTAKNFIKDKIEGYTTLIKSLDPSRWVGYVMSHSYNNPSGYYNNPNVDWFGGNIYVGWYIDKASNDPSEQIDKRVKSTITNLHKPLAFSEYGCGGTQHCHSESAETTTTKGNYERHDIEYMMWLHEGHIAAIRNYPQLLFTGQWQLFDIAVYNRNEGYIVCYDGETTSTDDNLRRLNNKGLVERDHVTKKDTFYLYKAEWNPTPFVHICGKDYTRMIDRAIKCYTNDGTEVSLYKNGTLMSATTITDHIAEFPRADYVSGDVILVSGATTNDTFTFE